MVETNNSFDRMSRLDRYDPNNPDKNSLHGRIFRKIRDDILDGKYEPGTAIRESKISNELGVSRTPVREAIRQLELEGLVSVFPNKGAVVTGITGKDIEDIYAIRSLVEGLAARWAAINITPQQIAELEEIMELMDFYAGKSDTRHIHELDTRFHDTLYEASHSKPLGHILSSFHHYVQKARLASISTPGRIQQAVQEHWAILDALKDADPERAELYANRHTKNAATNVLKQRKLSEETNN